MEQNLDLCIQIYNAQVTLSDLGCSTLLKNPRAFASPKLTRAISQDRKNKTLSKPIEKLYNPEIIKRFEIFWKRILRNQDF